MMCEVFKIVNTIAPIYIQILIMRKFSQYSLRKDKTAVVSRANTSKYGFKSIVHDGTACQMNCENCKLQRVSLTDPELGWSVMQFKPIALYYVSEQLAYLSPYQCNEQV